MTEAPNTTTPGTPSWRQLRARAPDFVGLDLRDVRDRTRMMALMSTTGPYFTVDEPTFVARFLLDPQTGSDASVSNVDAVVELADGSCWALTIVTVDEVRRLLTVWQETGEVANGSYLWMADQVLAPEPSIAVMTAAIRELVRTGDITSAGIQSGD